MAYYLSTIVFSHHFHACSLPKNVVRLLHVPCSQFLFLILVNYNAFLYEIWNFYCQPWSQLKNNFHTWECWILICKLTFLSLKDNHVNRLQNMYDYLAYTKSHSMSNAKFGNIASPQWLEVISKADLTTSVHFCCFTI